MRYSTLATFALLGAFSAVAPGCAAPEEDPVQGSSSKIQDGEEDNGHSFAVGIRLANGNLCSGVLIAPNVVLTAQHCVSYTNGKKSVDCKSDQFTRKVLPSEILVTTSSKLPTFSRTPQKPSAGGADDQTTKQPDEGSSEADNGASSMRSGANASSSSSSSGSSSSSYGVEKVVVPTEREICGADIALLILSDLVPSSEATPASPLIEAGMSQSAREVTAIGYGATGDNTSDGGRRRIKEDIPILCVPGASSSKKCSSDSPREFRTEGGVCLGDAGSGAFQTTSLDSAPVVFGVLSRADSNNGECSEGIYTRTDVYGSLIASTVIEAAADSSGSRKYTLPKWVVPTGSSEDSVPYPSQRDDSGSTTSAKFGDFDLGPVFSWLGRWLPKLFGSDDGQRRPEQETITCPDGTTRSVLSTVPCPEKPSVEVPAGGDRTYTPTTRTEDTSSTSSEDDSSKKKKEDDAPTKKKKKSSGCSVSFHDPASSPTMLGFIGLALAAAGRRRLRRSSGR